MEKSLSIEQIRSQFPDQWVLVGNPVLDNNSDIGSIIDKLTSGIVLLSSKDKREIGYKTKEICKGYNSVTCVYTGKIPQNRKWLL
jgi:hypothetical protein